MDNLDSLIALFITHREIFALFAFFIGLIVGSFLNVVIYRLPKMMELSFRHECSMLDVQDSEAASQQAPIFNLAVPRSRCPKCHQPISAVDNIPLISWLVLRGKCRHCGVSISARYPAIEMLTGLISSGIALHFGFSAQALLAILYAWFLITLFWIDADTYLLPDSLTLPLLWIGLIINISNTFTPLVSAVIGAAAGYLILWLVYWIFKLLTGKEGMGYGDFKLLAALGAWLGWQSLPLVILLSSVIGAIIGIAITVAAKRGWGTPLPFGPYLATAGLVVLLFGQQLQSLL